MKNSLLYTRIRKTFKAAFSVILFFSSFTTMNAQCYEQLYAGTSVDLVGVDKIPASSPIHGLACDINSKLGGGFTVYDATYYTVSEYGIGIEAQIESTIGSMPSGNYLLLYKISDRNGYNSRYGMKLNIPLVSGCLEQEQLLLKQQELTNYLKQYSSIETEMEFLLTKFKDYIYYMVDECCYSPSPPAGCADEAACDNLRPFLTDELGFDNQDLLNWFNEQDNLFKCQVQTKWDSDKSDEGKAVTMLGVYYIWVIDGTSNVVQVIPPLKDCIEGANLNDFLNGYSGEADIEALVDKAWTNNVNSFMGSDVTIKSLKSSTPSLGTLIWEFGSGIKQVWDSCSDAYDAYKSMSITTGDPITIFGKMIITILVELTPIGDVVAIWDGINKLKAGDIWSGMLDIGLGLLGIGFTIAAVVSGAGAVAIVAGAMLDIARLVKGIVAGGPAVLRGMKTGARFLVNLLETGASITISGGKFFIKNFCSGCAKIDFNLFCRLTDGCFVAGTPVIVGYNESSYFKKSIVAASIPFLVAPIEEIDIFDYVLANNQVNNSMEMAVASNQSTYSGLIDYAENSELISQEQKVRDEYKLDNKNWRKVSFSELNGNTKCEFALHNDWMELDERYKVNEIHFLNLPEQNIFGPFRITSIKHAVPQKVPEDIDQEDNYEYKPITGLITHESDHILNIELDGRDTLGVTSSHPVFSVTDGKWQLAGELRLGEQVLSLTGNATVTNVDFVGETRLVYNLEVKDFHNFLVGESGVVVHNGYKEDVAKFGAMSSAARTKFIDSAWGWWYPAWFKRGRFFEHLMVDTYYKAWKWTGAASANFPLIDFYKTVGGKTTAASMKTTKTATASSWMSTNAAHLSELVAKKGTTITQAGLPVKLDKVEIHIFVPKANFNSGTQSAWETLIKGSYPNIDKVVIETIENGL